MSRNVAILIDNLTSLDLKHLSLTPQDKTRALWVFTAATCAFLSASFITKCYKTYTLRRALGGIHNKPHPLFGNLHQHRGSGPKNFVYNIQQTTLAKTMYQFWFGPFFPVIFLVHPETIKVILKSTEPKYTNSSDVSIYRLVKGWLGDGLLVASGDKWFRNRKLLTPAFHFEILRPYLNVYHDAANKFMEKMVVLGDNGKQSVPIYSYVSLMTLDIILRCAFSYEGDIQAQGKNDPYISSVMNLTQLLVKRSINPFYHYSVIFHLSPSGWQYRKAVNYVHKVAEEVIEKRKRTLTENPGGPRKRYLDFLDILLAARDEDGLGLTDREIRNEVDTFLFEGHDTTASAISWLLYELARNPEIQRKVRLELQEMLPEGEMTIGWEHLSKMQYFSQCIKEAMRLNPPVPFVGRQLSQDMEIGGHVIPKNTTVGVSINGLHHNPHVWGEDYMEYKPERFDMNVKRDAYDFVPFSAGPRNCIGQNFALNEEKVVVGNILLRYEVKLDMTHKVEKHPEAVTRPTNDIKLFFQPLN